MGSIEGIGHAAHAHDHHVEVVVVAGMLCFRVQSSVERIQHVLPGNDPFVVFGIMQALHNGRNDVAAGAEYSALDFSDARTPEPGILAAPFTNG